ncbi:hypothetical protein WA158_001205 [Blastocystis sp. Blastoise]
MSSSLAIEMPEEKKVDQKVISEVKEEKKETLIKKDKAPKKTWAFYTKFVCLEILLVILGLAACHGGLSFITDPSGSSLQLTPDFLELIKPIGLLNWFLPGCFLFGEFCVGSFLTAIVLLINRRIGKILCIHICILMIAWISVQVSVIGLCLPVMQIGVLIQGIIIGILGFFL